MSNNEKKKRTEAMIKAQKKYYLKIKNEHPEIYKARNKKYAKIQYSKNKQKEGFIEQNRANVKEYYNNNKDLISEKRKKYYIENREEILEKQKINRLKRKEKEQILENKLYMLKYNDIDK